MSKALMVNGSRILTAQEAASIRSVISKPSNKALFDLMLYTGIRFSEVQQLVNNPDIFDEERKTVMIVSGKAKASQKCRNVMLCDAGMHAVKAFLDNPKLPSSSSSWQMNLIRWCEASGISTLPGTDASFNKYGITVRTTRKTLESWLLSAYPERIAWIALSQGHTETVSLNHYLNGAFTNGEKVEAVREVRGWME